MLLKSSLNKILIAWKRTVSFEVNSFFFSTTLIPFFTNDVSKLILTLFPSFYILLLLLVSLPFKIQIIFVDWWHSGDNISLLLLYFVVLVFIDDVTAAETVAIDLRLVSWFHRSLLVSLILVGTSAIMILCLTNFTSFTIAAIVVDISINNITSTGCGMILINKHIMSV